MAVAPGRLLARSFRQDCGVEPIQGHIGIGRSIPECVDDGPPAVVVVNEDESLGAFDQREYVEVVQGRLRSGIRVSPPNFDPEMKKVE